jgi:hypothetical protein
LNDRRTQSAKPIFVPGASPVNAKPRESIEVRTMVFFD